MAKLEIGEGNGLKCYENPRGTSSIREIEISRSN